MTTTSSTRIDTMADGTEQLRRRWTVDDPRAAMVLVHGIGEHSGRYEHVGAAFADAGIDVQACDLRGFGQSGGRRGHVDRFAQFLEDLGPQIADRRRFGVPVVLMGHSLGGLIVTTYLTTQQESGRPGPDLGVISAPALEAEMPQWQRLAAPMLGTITPKLFVPAAFDGSVLTRDTEVQDAFESDPLRVAGQTARLGREILRTMKATHGSLDRVRVPIYVFHGSDDELVPPGASEPLGRLPDATRRLWPGLRHECMNEPERDEVLAEIVAWLDGRLD